MLLKKVLVVEDEGVVALSLQASLTKMGYTVPVIAITGEEAVKMAKDHNPDVILMDIHLKGEMDGIQAAEKIKTFSDTPVIYLTAYADDETLSRALKTQSHSYLVKPYNPRELYSNIELAIYKQRLKDRVGSHRENLEAMFMRIADGGFIIDMKGNIVYANSPAEILTGWKNEELKGNNIFDLLDLHESSVGDAEDKSLSRILQLGAIHYLPAIGAITTRSGKNRLVNVRAGLIREDSGEHKNIMILLQEHQVGDLAHAKTQ